MTRACLGVPLSQAKGNDGATALAADLSAAPVVQADTRTGQAALERQLFDDDDDEDTRVAARAPAPREADAVLSDDGEVDLDEEEDEMEGFIDDDDGTGAAKPKVRAPPPPSRPRYARLAAICCSVRYARCPGWAC